MKLKKFGIIFLTLISAVTLSACNDVGRSHKTEMSSSNSSSSSSSETSESSSVAEGQIYEGKLIYSDNYIQVTNTNGLITFKNVSSKKIYVDGHGYIDDSYEIANMTFGYVGAIKVGTSYSNDINRLTLVNQAKEGDVLKVEKGNGEKLYDHIMKSGEKVTWTGTISNMERDELEAISFSFTY